MRFLLTLALALGALLAACGGGGGPKPSATGDGVTPTANPTVEPSRTPVEASPTIAEPPQAPVPDVDPSLEVLNLGELNLNIGPGDSYGFEPQKLTDEARPCGTFVFLFGWQVQDPYPPKSGEKLIIDFSVLDTIEAIGEGASGTATTECGFIDLRNSSDFPISVQVRYAVAQTTD